MNTLLICLAAYGAISMIFDLIDNIRDRNNSKIIVYQKDTGLNDYFNSDSNILIKALERKGFSNVYVQPSEWNGTRKYLFGIIQRKKEGRITARANERIFQLTLFKSDEDITIDLEK